MAQVHFRGVRYGVRIQPMVSALQVYCMMTPAEAKDFAERALRGERLSLGMEDPDVAYTLASELVELGVNAEVDDSDY